MSLPQYRSTRHAQNRPRWWRGTRYEMTIEDVVEVVLHPDRVTPTEKGRSNVWRDVQSHWIRVTYIFERDLLVISTITMKPDGPTEAE